jgi:hypothetical protein
MPNLLPDIPGWKSYKIHYGINRAYFQYSKFSSDAMEMVVDKKQPIDAFNSCPGCGSRQTVALNGAIVCSYCKGNL